MILTPLVIVCVFVSLMAWNDHLLNRKRNDRSDRYEAAYSLEDGLESVRLMSEIREEPMPSAAPFAQLWALLWGRY